MRTETLSNQKPILFDSTGHVTQRHEEAYTSIFDENGVLVRESNKSTDMTGGRYNALGQSIQYHQLAITTNPDGTFNLSVSNDFSEGLYNTLGDLTSFHQSDGQQGFSVETLTLPSNWEDLALKPEERLLWLTNLTFVVGAEKEKKGIDELNLMAPGSEGETVRWNELSSADRVRLLASGQTTLNGEVFRLENATVVWDLNTTNTYDQSRMTYSNYGALASYLRSGTDNGVAYSQNWRALGFDRYDRITGYTEDNTRAGTADTHLTRDNIVYDLRSLIASYRDTARSAATPDLVSVTQAEISYDALKRQTGVYQTVSQTGRDNQGHLLDVLQTVVMDAFAYDRFDRSTGYDEVRFQGETLNLAGQSRAWKSLSTSEKSDLRSGAVKTTDQLVSTTRMSGIAYTTEGQQKGYASVSQTRGVSSTPASTLPGASNLVDEASHAVRARTAYNNVGLAAEYWEGTSTNKEGAVQSLTHVHDINYNALGQQVKTISDLHKIGLDLDLFQTLQRDGMAYNSFGQIIGYVDHTTQNGLNVVTTVMDITYDREGRITSSKSVTNKQGEELQTFYTVGGNDLTPVQLAAFLEAHPGKTV
ncbi:MAG TPA: hypothetical protein PKD69_05930, partial [Elusimicrobiota bacterium]|nr:hypothetical protein [Elusimicrobiota bacterium]